tara:strand:+ start:2186 stop:2326 length:141 start_codon:yes stop_codon:yes gene_type:complete
VGEIEFFRFFLLLAFFYFLMIANGKESGMTGFVLYALGRFHGKFYD